jgi:hypothetical protein
LAYHIIEPNWKAIYENKTFRKIVVIILLLSFLIYGAIKIFFGNDNIGSFFSRHSYDATYMVFAQPDNNTTKYYFIKSDIHVSGSDIYLYKIYWPNGGYTSFREDETYIGEKISLNSNNYCRDTKEKDWFIFLTNYKSKK